MLLSADVFDAVVARLAAGPPGGAGGQRRGPRSMLDTRLTIIPYPEGLGGQVGPPLSVPVRDLSRGGMRFLLPQRLPLDTPFVTLLPRAHHTGVDESQDAPDPVEPKPLAVLCAVAYWQPLAKDLFALGGEFTRVLSAVDRFEPPAAQPLIVLPELPVGEQPAGQSAAALRRAVG